VLVLEDTIELQCAARDHVPLRTRAGVVSMTELVRATMRLRPDRVIVGEVRGGEAGSHQGVGHRPPRRHRHHPRRLRAGRAAAPGQLILEVAVNPPRALIAEAVNVVIHIAGRGRKRRVEASPASSASTAWAIAWRTRWKRRFPSCRRFLSQPIAPSSSLTNLENCHDADARSRFP
jgi:type IV secretion system protein VirB11